MEFSGNDRRGRLWLAAADADGVITLSDDWITILGNHSQIAILQVKFHLLTRTWLEMNSLKSTKSNLRGALHFRKLEIDLHNFISSDFAGVADHHCRSERLPRSHSMRGKAEVAVFKGRVAESITKGIERP